jgi:8-oxo-dGTP pyrophosphatase MutT (NUDIX family)
VTGAGNGPAAATGSVAATGTGSVAANGEGLWTPREELVLDLRQLLAHAPSQTPDDRFEAWAWRALLDEDGPALLTRQARPSHVTASAIVLSPDARRTCLVLHGRIGLWVQPGGHLEPQDASVGAAAAREVAEETGLAGQLLPDIAHLSRHHAPCRPEVDWHLDMQFILVAAEDRPQVSAESQDVQWWDVDSLPPGLAQGAAQTVARAVRRLTRVRSGTPSGR